MGPSIDNLVVALVFCDETILLLALVLALIQISQPPKPLNNSEGRLFLKKKKNKKKKQTKKR